MCASFVCMYLYVQMDACHGYIYTQTNAANWPGQRQRQGHMNTYEYV